MSTRKSWQIVGLALAMLAPLPAASAQEKADKKSTSEAPVVEQRQEVYIQRDGNGGGGGMSKGDTFVFVSSEMSYDGKVVKGVPYSAQAVTETVQTLADGNRIVHRNTANVYRDSEGRTRRDQELGAIGPFASAGEPSRTSFINDPVAGVNYILDPRTRTARKLPRIEFRLNKEPGATRLELKDKSATDAAKDQTQVRIQRNGDAHSFVFEAPLPPPDLNGADVRFTAIPAKSENKYEKLDARTIEGVQAEGTRVTTTIPAGAVGNEQPIVMTHERWYSPELQTVVMSRHNDPRFGETTYRLTGISRGEPSPALFQVPPDYTVKEAAPFVRELRRERRPEPPAPPQNN